MNKKITTKIANLTSLLLKKNGVLAIVALLVLVFFFNLSVSLGCDSKGRSIRFTIKLETTGLIYKSNTWKTISLLYI